jgi:hypothetical protein
MSDFRTRALDELKARLQDAIDRADAGIDRDDMLARIEEIGGKAGRDLDTEALLTRLRQAMGKTEGRIDRQTLQGWLDEAKTIGGRAASLVAEQGGRLADRAPDAAGTLADAAKATLRDLTGDEGPIGEPQRQRLKEQAHGAAARVIEAARTDAREAAKIVKEEFGKSGADS